MHQGVQSFSSNDLDGSPGPDRLKGLTVLLVEDDPDCRELLELFLTTSGATCFLASSGNQAFAIFSEKHPDVVISDMWMPDGDGYELIRRIRSLRPEDGGLVPAIAVSGAANRDQALTAGYHMLISKPYDADKILEAIVEFLRGEDEQPSRMAPWTITVGEGSTLVMTWVGRVRASDMKACMAVLARHLAHGRHELVNDLTRIGDFSLAAASVAQRIVWPLRDAILRVRIVGGSNAARSISAGACRMLGLEYTLE